jgi:hypothetical protein
MKARIAQETPEYLPISSPGVGLVSLSPDGSQLLYLNYVAVFDGSLTPASQDFLATIAETDGSTPPQTLGGGFLNSGGLISFQPPSPSPS